MRRDDVYEDYAAARKNLISKVRHSFDEAVDGSETKMDEPPAVMFYESAKLRLFLAMLLFIGFLYCWYTNTKIFGYTAKNIVEMMEDDRYYTMLKEYIDIEDNPSDKH